MRVNCSVLLVVQKLESERRKGGKRLISCGDVNVNARSSKPNFLNIVHATLKLIPYTLNLEP